MATRAFTGLTCTEETFPIKAGAQRIAAELGLMLVCPDTSPRGAQVPGEANAWDFGVGAGFYLDAVREPWASNWRMESYVTGELRQGADAVDLLFAQLQTIANGGGEARSGHAAAA